MALPLETNPTDGADSQTLLQRLAELMQIPPEVLIRLIGSLLVVLVILVVRGVLLRLARRHIDDIKRHHRWRRTINYVAGFLGLLIVARIWLPGMEQIGVFLGLASAGLAIALRDPLMCVAGWVFILVRRPFSMGDRIEIQGQVGDVIDIRMFQTYMLEVGGWLQGEQATGRIVMVPNSLVFSTSVANYTQGFDFIWDEMVVRLSFESDWRTAKKLLLSIAEQQGAPMCDRARAEIKQAAAKHMIFFQNLTATVYTSVQEWGIQLTVRYLTPTRQRRSTAQRLWEAILDAFAAEDSIRFAYPTTRFYTGASGPRPGKVDDSPTGPLAQ